MLRSVMAQVSYGVGQDRLETVRHSAALGGEGALRHWGDQEGAATAKPRMEQHGQRPG